MTGAMTSGRTDAPPSPAQLRTAGAMYLAIIALGLFGEIVVRGTLVVPGAAPATLAAIAAQPGLWRLGVAGDLLMHLLDVPVMLLLYRLLRPAGPGLALLATAFNAVQTAVLALNKLTLLLPLMLLDGSGAMGAFTLEQRAALLRLALQAHNHGFAIGLVFFGITCTLRGWLVWRGSAVPRWLGPLLLAAGVGYVVNSAALLLWPALASLLFPWVLLPAFVAELSLALWLVTRSAAGPKRI